GLLGRGGCLVHGLAVFFFSSRRRHTRWPRDWSSDVCSSDLNGAVRLTEALRDGLSDLSEWNVLEVAFGRQSIGGRRSAGRDTGQIGRASCRERVHDSVARASSTSTTPSEHYYSCVQTTLMLC